MNVNLSMAGVSQHLPSTMAGVLMLASAFGLLNVDQVTQISSQIPALTAGATGMLGIIGLFYHKPDVTPSSPPAADNKPAAQK